MSLLATTFGASSGISSEQVLIIVALGLLAIVVFVLPYFSNRRKAAMYNELVSALEPGCIVKMMSGIIGKVIEINEITPVDKEILIETGSGDSKSTILFDFRAVIDIVRLANGERWIPSYLRPKMPMPAQPFEGAEDAVDPLAQPVDEDIERATSTVGATTADIEEQPDQQDQAEEAQAE